MIRLVVYSIFIALGSLSVGVAAEHPNVVIFLADDQGRGDLSSTGIRTSQRPISIIFEPV